MSATRIFDDERDAPPPPRAEPDPVSVALGHAVYVRSHRINLHLDANPGHTPRLVVSRYYWDTEPPVAVDFVREVRYGRAEVRAKREYFRERGIRYLLLTDEFDAEGVRARSQAPPAGQEDQRPALPPRRPQAAPRPNPTKRR